MTLCSLALGGSPKPDGSAISFQLSNALLESFDFICGSCHENGRVMPTRVLQIGRGFPQLRRKIVRSDHLVSMIDVLSSKAARNRRAMPRAAGELDLLFHFASHQIVALNDCGPLAESVTATCRALFTIDLLYRLRPPPLQTSQLDRGEVFRSACAGEVAISLSALCPLRWSR